MNEEQRMMRNIFNNRKGMASIPGNELDVFASTTVEVVKALQKQGFSRKEAIDIFKTVVANQRQG